ncbi:hypothetical protein EDB19DRAFT_1739551 [Suillus lakei]|nr:hypothetical protein EDB19DRAFT_1739551 [Suillus lakei]
MGYTAIAGPVRGLCIPRICSGLLHSIYFFSTLNRPPFQMAILSTLELVTVSNEPSLVTCISSSFSMFVCITYLLFLCLFTMND